MAAFNFIFGWVTDTIDKMSHYINFSEISINIQLLLEIKPGWEIEQPTCLLLLIE